MWVIFNTDNNKADKAMICFYENREKQCNLMHRKDIDDQVREWQKSNTGQPPKFYSRINIKEFTNRQLNIVYPITNPSI